MAKIQRKRRKERNLTEKKELYKIKTAKKNYARSCKDIAIQEKNRQIHNVENKRKYESGRT